MDFGVMDTCAPACVIAGSQPLAFFLEFEITFLVGWNSLRAEAASTLDALKQVTPPTNGRAWGLESLGFGELGSPYACY